MKQDSSGVVTFTVQPTVCGGCGHHHGGADVGFICIGCPCPERMGAVATVADVANFDPMAELAKWRRWATDVLGGDGFQGDEEQRHKLSALERIAKAATAFVDEQGKRVDGQYGLRDVDDFALGRWRALVDAVKAAGR